MTVTATSMKLKFPEFASLSDTTIEFAIEEASLGTSDNWTTGYIDLSIMYLAAHLLAAGRASANIFTGGGGGEIQSESIGRMSITYKSGFTSNAGAVADDYTSSTYGRRYIDMRDMTFGGPVVI